MTTMTVSIDVDALSAASVDGAGRSTVFAPVAETAAYEPRTTQQFQAAMGGALAENVRAQQALATAMSAVSAAFCTVENMGDAAVAPAERRDPLTGSSVVVDDGSDRGWRRSADAIAVTAPESPVVAKESPVVVDSAVRDAPLYSVKPVAEAVVTASESSVVAKESPVMVDSAVRDAPLYSAKPVAEAVVTAPESPVVAKESSMVADSAVRDAPLYSAKPVADAPVTAKAAAVPGKKTDIAPNADALVAAGVAPHVVEGAAVVAAPTAETAAVEAASARTVLMADGVAKTVSTAEVLVAAAEAVADAILVTPGLVRGEGEVRIQLRPDVLEGTEVRIAVQGRSLDVSFVPQTESMAALIEQCRPQLEQHLAGRIHAFQIAVSVKGGGSHVRGARVRGEELA